MQRRYLLISLYYMAVFHWFFSMTGRSMLYFFCYGMDFCQGLTSNSCINPLQRVTATSYCVSLFCFLYSPPGVRINVSETSCKNLDWSMVMCTVNHQILIYLRTMLNESILILSKFIYLSIVEISLIFIGVGVAYNGLTILFNLV